ncbi:glycine/betaine ABC transporter permease [Agromyces luteolus]|uniref:Glycine/betaine ABC transporter n=1 Tax=Agromyces luteolus TaxID=88373 RepID=A0A7C9MGL5_9MICO|nr:ABC transporter substrate-binding protein [Agromyces luteolus]MUN06738.1 glycine/betaine ABC transporter [Agromyces luteolus]GLK27746.1 glycine/betaine ABC transporter permease [Agromyces luteolus]
MITAGKGRLVALAAVAVGATVALAGCASGDPLDSGSDGGDAAGETIVVGSQDYYSNEIIAELYAQALEENGYTVDRQFRIGQREVYIPEIESGSIDVFPEYTGNLLQYYVPDTTATTSDDVYAELSTALPDGLRVLEQSPATDQDSYNVTQAFSDEYGVTSLADLADVDASITLGGNSELETRPYGPEGLQSVYGVEVAFTPIEDSGGPLTLKALVDDQVQMVNIFSADPNIAANDLVTLEDPEGLFLASNVVPVVSEKVDDDIAGIIDTVSAALTAEELVALNALSVNEQQSAEQIASDWLAEQSLF